MPLLPAAATVLLLLLSSCAAPGEGLAPGGAAIASGQGIRGTLISGGAPVAGAYVYAYRRYTTNLLGPADFASAPSADDGSYKIDLVRGTYYVVARKRSGGGNTGPLAVGDYQSLHPSRPVAVEDGRFTDLDLELMQMRDPMFFQALSREESPQGIRGVIVDGDGNPVPWVFAMAYTAGDMKRIPEFTSSMTSEDGAFVIHLPRPGRYWIAARKNIRERPVEGEPYGLYRGSEDHSVLVPDGGYVEGITIRLEPYHKGIQD